MLIFKCLLRLFFALSITCSALQLLQAQNIQGQALADSLKTALAKTKVDTARVKIMVAIARALLDTDPATAMKYADGAMQLSRLHNWEKGIGLAYLNKARVYAITSDYSAGLENAGRAYKIFDSLHWKEGMGSADWTISNLYRSLGNYTKAIEDNFKSLDIYEELGMENNVASLYNNIGNDYYELNNYPKAIENYKKSYEVLKKTNDKFGIASALDDMASAYEAEGEFKNVNEYNLEAIKLFEEINDKPALGRIYNNRGNILSEQMHFDSAIFYYKKAIAIAESINIKSTVAYGYFGLGDAYRLITNDSSSKYTMSDSLKELSKNKLLQRSYDSYKVAFEVAENIGNLSLLVDVTKSLSETEALRGNYKAALDFYTKSTEFKDSIFNDENKTKIAALENERITEVKNKEIQLLNKENALQSAHSNLIYSILSIAFLAVIIIAVIQYRNSNHRQKANILLTEQKQKVESTLNELKSTQAQLVQSEKMASLGELTAGIAHEIQNPLNFVNNFSDVNRELLSELKDEIKNGNAVEASAIANDIIENEEKINHHGKRADAIVKGMLQHSKQNKGVKEPTDINALCNEYLRLSYHGLRAKDKNFNADVKTDFDESLSADEASIGKINVVPQDIGRVLLNLFNNAFYALSIKVLADSNYKPLISVRTKKINNKVEISIKDNGNGIPSNIIDKIFQPFFTTKPTGQGTGLGLSLAYDIITKEHNGIIKVESKEGEGTVFIIQLSNIF